MVYQGKSGQISPDKEAYCKRCSYSNLPEEFDLVSPSDPFSFGKKLICPNCGSDEIIALEEEQNQSLVELLNSKEE